MSIQRVREKDVDTVKEILKLFFGRGSNQEQIKKFLFDEKNYMLAYKCDGEVAGFAYGFELQRFDGRKNMMYMHQIEVQSKFRKKGIGKQLMKEFIKICKENNCGRLFLITNKSNQPAVNLYESADGKAHHDDDIVFTYEL